MKRLKFHRAIVAIAMMLIGWLPSLAHDFEVDGIFYNKTSDNTVAVTFKGNSKNDNWAEYNGDVVIPSSVYYNGTYSVTSIGEWAFYDCLCLTSIEIPNSVTSIGDYAFSDCRSLTSIQIPNSVTSIGEWAFYDCWCLTSVEIGNSVTSIGEGAFNSCTSLTSIVVDSGNTKYDSRNDCNAIIETASNTLIAGCQNTIIPNNVTSIGNYAFYCCTSLTSIEIPNSVTSIGHRAFAHCERLTGIEIPNSVKSIGNEAFEYCYDLTSVVIGNSVTWIGERAFSDCYDLTSVVIGNSVTWIGGGAFYDCESLTKITCWATTPPTIEYTFSDYSATLYVPIGCKATYESAEYWKNFNVKEMSNEVGAMFSANGLNYVITVKEHEVAVDKWSTNYYSGDIVIPQSVEYGDVAYSVTSIGKYAFEDCSSLTSIVIPNSVTSIGEWAFYGCYDLTSIEIPNSVTSIGVHAFYKCSSLTDVVIGNSVTSIGYNPFGSCENLTSIVVDAGNSKYDSRNGCNAIIETASNTLIAGCQNTIIPNSVTSIGDYAFNWCASLTSIEIPNSVTSIGNYAFYYCESLTSIEIPNSVTSIGYGAFRECSSLTKITCWATTPPTIKSDTFSNYSAKLYVPVGCKSVYQSANYWKNFNIINDTLDKPITLNDNDAIVATIGENIVVKNAMVDSVVRVYTADGAMIASEVATEGDVIIEAPVKGIYVVKVGKQTVKVII